MNIYSGGIFVVGFFPGGFYPVTIYLYIHIHVSSTWLKDASHCIWHIFSETFSINFNFTYTEEIRRIMNDIRVERHVLGQLFWKELSNLLKDNLKGIHTSHKKRCVLLLGSQQTPEIFESTNQRSELVRLVTQKTQIARISLRLDGSYRGNFFRFF